VTAALPFLAQAGRVTILTAARSKKNSAEGSRLRDYLCRHSVRAQTQTLAIDGQVVGEAIHEASQDVSTDLMVVGGFTHRRLRQTLFGGVTSYILDQHRGTILMAH
jgi:nucleotide-binding universal stress UspA family protein